MQHLTAIVFALSVFFINALSKLLPDWIIPFQLGQDTVYLKEYEPEKLKILEAKNAQNELGDDADPENYAINQ